METNPPPRAVCITHASGVAHTCDKTRDSHWSAT